MAQQRIRLAQPSSVHERAQPARVGEHVDAPFGAALSGKVKSRAQTRPKAIGLCLLALVAALFALPPISALARWQSRLDYKSLTGVMLVSFLAFQLLLSVARARRWGQAARRLYSLHRVVGVFGPVLLYLHASRIGYGYLVLLSGAFLTSLMLGLTFPASPRAPRRTVASWTVAHIAVSVALVALVAYHIWQALYYE